MGSGYLCSTVLPRMSSLQCPPLSYNRKVRDDKLPRCQHAMPADILIIIYCDMGHWHNGKNGLMEYWNNAFGKALFQYSGGRDYETEY
jgi:hypothetical protein